MVIQGSKLPALLYTLYINKVIILQKLIDSEVYDIITGESKNDNYDGVDHDIIQYVDDTNNVISTNNLDKLQPYINTYFELIESFYNINKVKINLEKSKLMIVCKAARWGNTYNIVINTDIKVHKLKVPRMHIMSSLSNHTNVNNNISKVNYRLSILKIILKFTEQ